MKLTKLLVIAIFLAISQSIFLYSSTNSIQNAEFINKCISENTEKAKSIIRKMQNQLKQLNSLSTSDTVSFSCELRNEINELKNHFDKDFDNILSSKKPEFFIIMQLFKNLYIWVHITQPPKMMVLNPIAPLMMGTSLSRAITPDSSLPIVFVVGDYHESLMIIPRINSPIALLGAPASNSNLTKPAFTLMPNPKVGAFGEEIYNQGLSYIGGFVIYNCTAPKGPAFYINNSRGYIGLNIIFNCRATEMGGAIYSTCNLSFPIIMSTAPYILGNIMINNSAPRGGAMAFESDGAVAALNVIQNNYASEFGGGAFISESGTRFIGNIVINNKSDDRGAGIAVRKCSAPIVSMNFIRKNETKRSGGGIWVTRGGGIRMPSLLAFNYITENTAIDEGGGIAVDNEGDAVIILNTAIEKNKAIKGGGISLNKPSQFSYVMGNRIMDNEADYGGGIWADDFNNSISTFNAIYSNKAKIAGGGIFLDHGNTYVSNNFIENNEAPLGGGIYYIGIGYPTFFDNHRISGNKAEIGAGLYIINARKTSIEGNGFADNKAKDKGGAIYLNNCDNPEIFGKNNFLRNEARFGGAIFYENSTYAKIYDNLFQLNMAKNGGGIYVNYKYSDIFNNQFIGNESSGSGAAIFVPGGMQPTIINNTFIGNLAGSTKAPQKTPVPLILNVELAGGAGIYVSGYNANPTIKYNLFKSNIAPFGAGIAVLDSAKPIVTSNDYIDNYAKLPESKRGGIGGGIYVSNTSITIDSSLFAGNYAMNGAGAAIAGNASVDFINSEFKWNIADIDSTGLGMGAGIFGINKNTKINIGTTTSSCTFSENFSAFGAAIAGKAQAEFNIMNNLFISNRVAYNTNGAGGALHFEGEGTLAKIGGNYVENKGNTFRLNTAGTIFKAVSGNGGVLSTSDKAIVELQGNTIYDHNAANNLGGAVYITGKGTSAIIGGENDDEIIKFPSSEFRFGNIIQNNNRRNNIYPIIRKDLQKLDIIELDTAECELEKPIELLDSTVRTVTKDYDSSPTMTTTIQLHFSPRIFLYVSNLAGGVQIYNISTAGQINYMTRINSNDKTYKLKIHNEYLLIADGYAGVKIYNTSTLLLGNPPILIDDLAIADVSIVDLAYYNNYIYALGDNDVIYILQFANNELTLSNTFEVNDINQSDIGSIHTANGLIFLDITRWGNSSFNIFAPTGNSLQFRASRDINGIISDMNIRNNRAYILSSRASNDTTIESRLYGIDYSVPTNPIFVSVPDVTTTQHLTSINVYDNYIYLGLNDGYRRVNLFDGTSITFLIGKPVINLSKFEDRIYIAHGYYGMIAYNTPNGQPTFQSQRPEQSATLESKWLNAMPWYPDTSWYWAVPEHPDTVVCENSKITKIKENCDEILRLHPDSLKRDNYVYDNEDVIITKRGGFLAVTDGANVNIFGNLIGGKENYDGNKATEYGGGIYIRNGGNNIKIGPSDKSDEEHTKNYFLGNQAKCGGAISLYENLNHKILLQNNIFGGFKDIEANQAHLYGGAIHSDSSIFTFKENIVQYNFAGIDSLPNCSEIGFGGGLALFESSAEIKNNWFVNNYCFGNAAGIGLGHKLGRIQIENNTFSANTAIKSRIGLFKDSLGLGDDLFISSINDTLSIRNNIFDHFGLLDSYAIYADSSKKNDTTYGLNINLIDFSNNNVFSNLGMNYGGLLTDRTGKNGNISINPLFSDPSSGNFNLDPTSPATGKGWSPRPASTKISNKIYYVPDNFSTITEAMLSSKYGDKIIVNPHYNSINETFPIKIKDGVILIGRGLVTPHNLNLTNRIMLDAKYQNAFEMENTSPRTAIAGFTLKNANFGILANNSAGYIIGNIIYNSNKGIALGFLQDTSSSKEQFNDKLFIDHNTVITGIDFSYDIPDTSKRAKNDFVHLHKMQLGPVFSYNIAKISGNIRSDTGQNIYQYPTMPPVFISFEMNNFWQENLSGYYDGITDIAKNNLRLSPPKFVSETDFHLLQGSRCLLVDSIIKPEKPDTIHKFTNYTGIIGAQYALIRPNFFADTLSGPPNLKVKFTDTSKSELRHELKVYKWLWGNYDTTKYISKTYPQTLSYTYEKAGTYSVVLRIKDRYAEYELHRKDYINADTSWKDKDEGILNNLNCIYFVDEQNGWIAGDNGIILKTTDSGENWYEQSTGIIINRESGNFTEIWSKINLKPLKYIKKKEFIRDKIQSITEDILTLYFFNTNNGWLAGKNGIIYNTNDGGLSWNSQQSNTYSDLTNIYFTDRNNGIACGRNGTTLLTTTGGNIWIPVNTGYENDLNGLFVHPEKKAWIVGNNGLILFSDNSTYWSGQNSGVTNNLYSVFFADTNNGWVVGSNGVIIATTDGGKNWRKLESNTNHSLQAVTFNNQNLGWTVGKKGTILYTTNSGSTWLTQYSGTKEGLNSIFFIDSLTGWAVGDNGTIIYTLNGGKTPNYIIDKYSRFNIFVYPNPFSESTNIYYELQTADRVRIEIFNSLGEKIATLVDGWQEAGRHNCELRITNYELSAGMYYYKIQIGERIESGKLLLIK